MSNQVGYRSCLLSIIVGGAWLGFLSSPLAAQPPDSVTSDANFNTAMGSGALISLVAGSTSFGNTAAGDTALSNLSNANYNTAFGAKAMASNFNGGGNSGFGYGALYTNASGSFNTATGYHALFSGALNDNNTATGYQALFSNGANDNTAVGFDALVDNTAGSENTAVGSQAMESNTGGFDTTAVGFQALFANTSGNSNSAFGDDALGSNTQGHDNVALGASALYSNLTGDSNVAIGTGALEDSVGNSNIAIGTTAGQSITTGSNNIDIGNLGEAKDVGVIRIGNPGTQKQLFLAGVESSKITGSAVYVTSAGRLGVLASSERYKTAIAPMGAQTDRLELLRPITFHLKSNPTGALQYGLIAEDVAKVYPELVTRDTNGKIQGVRYDELAPMLVNEVQRMKAQLNEVVRLKEVMRHQQQQLDNMQAVISKLQGSDERLAAR